MKKNEIVTVICSGVGVVFIRNTKIVSSGEKRTKFECFDSFFETPTITPTIESIEEKIRCYTCVAPNEDFIKRYIEVAKKQQSIGLEKVKKLLMVEPHSKRYKRHLKLYENEVCVKDLRENKEINYEN